jgi:hypothetical protein
LCGLHTREYGACVRRHHSHRTQDGRQPHRLRRHPLPLLLLLFRLLPTTVYISAANRLLAALLAGRPRQELPNLEDLRVFRAPLAM